MASFFFKPLYIRSGQLEQLNYVEESLDARIRLALAPRFFRRRPDDGRRGGFVRLAVYREFMGG